MAKTFMSSLCIIALVIALSVPFTTRVDAATVSELQYQVWFPDMQILAVSDAEWVYENYGYTSAVASRKYAYNREGVCVLAITSNSDGTYYSLVTSSANSYLLTYVEGVGWSSTPTNYWYSQSEGIAYYCIASKSQTFTFYSSHDIDGITSSGAIPDLPEVVDVEALINDQLNRQTDNGAAAATIINNTTINYNSYVAGDITHTEMQQIVTDNLDQLSELSGATGNTLSDLMQINNAITYNQSIQDQLHNTVSASTLDLINQYLSATNSDVYEYQNGTRDQQSATNSIRNRIRYLEARIVDGTINTTADIAAVQTAISTMQAALDSVIGYSDVSQEASDKSQASDAEELAFLDALEAETTTTVEQLSPYNTAVSSSEISEAGNVFGIVWEMDFIKKLVMIAAGFMVVSVAIGVRYKL